jgi:hypothetical protein
VSVVLALAVLVFAMMVLVVLSWVLSVVLALVALVFAMLVSVVLSWVLSVVLMPVLYVPVSASRVHLFFVFHG